MNNKDNKKIVIIDYNLGNLFSVKHACESIGIEAIISSDKKEILDADALILPGVGAFGDAMKNMESLDLISPVKDFVETGKPLLGICLGMQLLLESSQEFGSHKGLGLIEGYVTKFPAGTKEGKKNRVPQIGWNRIYPPAGTDWQTSPLETVAPGEFMYFVHSYYVVPSNEQNILTMTEYESIKYCSGVVKNNIFAVQFHPEKSAAEGIKIYREWAKMIHNHNFNLV